MGQRQDIMDAVAIQLATISAANGYQTEIGANVNTWRPKLLDGAYIPFETAELPAIMLADRRCESKYLDFETHEHRLAVEIEARVQGGATSDDSLRLILDDIRRAISIDPTWGARAIDTEPQSDEFAIVQGDQTFGGVLINITIIYQTGPWAAS